MSVNVDLLIDKFKRTLPIGPLFCFEMSRSIGLQHFLLKWHCSFKSASLQLRRQRKVKVIAIY